MQLCSSGKLVRRWTHILELKSYNWEVSVCTKSLWREAVSVSHIVLEHLPRPRPACTLHPRPCQLSVVKLLWIMSAPWLLSHFAAVILISCWPEASKSILIVFWSHPLAAAKTLSTSVSSTKPLKLGHELRNSKPTWVFLLSQASAYGIKRLSGRWIYVAGPNNTLCVCVLYALCLCVGAAAVRLVHGLTLVSTSEICHLHCCAEKTGREAVALMDTGSIYF